MGGMFLWMFDGEQWVEGATASEAPWLRVTVHDSTVCVFEYEPRYGGSGVAFAGCAPRTYFEDESIPATDKPREVEALATWFAANGLGAKPESYGLLNTLLVGEGELSPEPFVEESVQALFVELGHPLPFD